MSVAPSIASSGIFPRIHPLPFFVTNVVEETSLHLIAICVPTVKMKMKKKRKDKPKIQSTIGKKTYNKYTVCDKKRVALLMESYKKDYDAELAAKPAEYDPKKKNLA